MANTSNHPVLESVPKWNFKKPKWDAFQNRCITEITLHIFIYANYKLAVIPSKLFYQKEKSTFGFDEDAKKEWIKATEHPNAPDSIPACSILARAKKVFKQNKRTSWKNYVSSVNIKTSPKTVGDIIRKIPSKPHASFMDVNDILISDRMEIANTLGTAIGRCSSSGKHSKEFEFIKAQNENHKKKIFVETKVASAYVCLYGTLGYRIRDGCSSLPHE